MAAGGTCTASPCQDKGNGPGVTLSPVDSLSPMKPADLGFGRLFATIRDAVIVTDVVSGRIVLSNPAVSTMLGYNADELAGQKVAAILPNYGRIIDDSEPIELVAVRKDGVEISVDATLRALD